MTKPCKTPSKPQLTVFFDGSCPLCSREMSWLMKRIPDGKVVFEDISTDSFEEHYPTLNRQDLMKQIHAQDAGGKLLNGIEVFRKLYSLAGLGWLLYPTAWPLLRPLSDRLYLLFAKHRLFISKFF